MSDDLGRTAEALTAAIKEQEEQRVSLPSYTQMMLYGVVVGATAMLSVTTTLNVFDWVIPFWLIFIGIAYQVVVARRWGRAQVRVERSRPFRDLQENNKVLFLVTFMSGLFSLVVAVIAVLDD